MVIGLNGRLKSGKDTTFQIIQELYPHAERVSFADKLKDSAAASLNMSRDSLEKLKNIEDIQLGLIFPASEEYDEIFNEMIEWSMTIREYLQRYGTESHRDVFGTDFWVDQALPLDINHFDRLIVVTDVRFPNEVQRVKDVGGTMWKVERETATAFGAHPSEQDLDSYINVFVDNTGTLDDLRAQVKQLLDRTMVPC